MALAFLVGEVIIPATALASCGDYLTVGGKSHAADASAAPCHGVHCKQSDNAMNSVEHPKPASTPSPCHGPNCSQAPQDSPIQPAPPSTSSVDERALAIGWFLKELDPVAETIPEAGALRGLHRATDIFHPPRSNRIS